MLLPCDESIQTSQCLAWDGWIFLSKRQEEPMDSGKAVKTLLRRRDTFIGKQDDKGGNDLRHDVQDHVWMEERRLLLGAKFDDGLADRGESALKVFPAKVQGKKQLEDVAKHIRAKPLLVEGCPAGEVLRNRNVIYSPGFGVHGEVDAQAQDVFDEGLFGMKTPHAASKIARLKAIRHFPFRIRRGDKLGFGKVISQVRFPKKILPDKFQGASGTSPKRQETLGFQKREDAT
mmetsp:Transcript_95215/g.142671  ORF Transcript_95215/g.142671 Transcript_95215/m.142671 type:complete len:232 (+) Transcript_95215:1407-2102(+)